VSSAASRPAPLKWRPRAFLLLATGTVAILGGVVATAPALLFLGLPLLLAPLAALLYGAPADPRATVAWRVEGTGGTVDVVGSIAVGAPVRARDLELEFVRPSALAEQAPPRTEVEDRSVGFRLSWSTASPVVVPVPAPRLVWSDPMGLLEREVRTTVPALVVERYPPELLHIGAVRLERTTILPGETRSRRIGASGEFYGIRAAAPAEPPRRINWRASARAGRLLANEFELDRTGDVLLLIDARPTSLGRSVDERLLGLSVAAASGLADAFLREKARVGLAVFGEFVDPVPMATGRTQRLRIRQALVRARLTRSPGPAERCAVAIRRQFPPGITTVLFSSLGDEESDHLLTFLRRRGFPAVVVSPSPLPLQAEVRALPADEEALVDRIARLVRRDRLAHTWQSAPVVDWEDYWSLGGLVELLRRPGRWGRRT
jgi:uncharacterized protein (DUF58 family)